MAHRDPLRLHRRRSRALIAARRRGQRPIGFHCGQRTVGQLEELRGQARVEQETSSAQSRDWWSSLGEAARLRELREPFEGVIVTHLVFVEPRTATPPRCRRARWLRVRPTLGAGRRRDGKSRGCASPCSVRSGRSRRGLLEPRMVDVSQIDGQLGKFHTEVLDQAANCRTRPSVLCHCEAGSYRLAFSSPKGLSRHNPKPSSRSCSKSTSRLHTSGAGSGTGVMSQTEPSGEPSRAWTRSHSDESHA